MAFLGLHTTPQQTGASLFTGAPSGTEEQRGSVLNMVQPDAAPASQGSVGGSGFQMASASGGECSLSGCNQSGEIECSYCYLSFCSHVHAAVHEATCPSKIV